LGNVLLQLSVAIGHVRFSYVSAILLLVGQAAYVAAIASAVFYEYVNGSISFSRKGLRSWRPWLYLVTVMVLIVVFPLLITRGLHAGVLEKILVCLVTAVIAVIIASTGLFMVYRREIKRTRMQMLIMSTVSDQSAKFV
jgi:uncharacterized membrane protein YfcA